MGTCLSANTYIPDTRNRNMIISYRNVTTHYLRYTSNTYVLTKGPCEHAVDIIIYSTAYTRYQLCMHGWKRKQII